MPSCFIITSSGVKVTCTGMARPIRKKIKITVLPRNFILANGKAASEAITMPRGTLNTISSRLLRK